jgi:RNA polymerase sigma-70 factor (ECF subfamily)
VTRLVDITIGKDLLERACRGDAAGQAAIYSLVAPATFALIRRLAANRALAEDLFQDTMMTFYQRLPQFRGAAPLGAWLRQIAVSKCLMYLRSPWHRLRFGLDVSADGGIVGATSTSCLPPPPESLDVERALETLSPTARAVIWLYEVEGYSHEEIAREFGRSISFSKSQLARAHRRMREWFEPHVDRQTCTPI